jgi:hypothetical protein
MGRRGDDRQRYDRGEQPEPPGPGPGFAQIHEV